MTIKWDDQQRQREVPVRRDRWHETDTQMRDTLSMCLVVVLILLLCALYVAEGPKWPEGNEIETRRFESTGSAPGRPGRPTLRSE